MERRAEQVVGAWGKRGRDAPLEAPELSLLGHCADVAAVTEALLGIGSIRKRMERLAGRDLLSTDISRVCCFALWHDLGKANVGFWSQRFGDEGGAQMRRRAGLDVADRGHTTVVATLLRHDKTRERLAAAFPLAAVLAWGESALPLLWAAISHHGTPLYWSGGDEMVGMDRRSSELTNAWAPIDGYDPIREIGDLGDAAHRWFPGAFVTDVRPLPKAPRFVHAFAGLVSLADWIASNPEPAFFPYAGDGGDDRMAFARPRAKEVLKRMCVDVEEARAALRARDPTFKQVFGFTPSDTQAEMARTDLGRVVAIESETGSGKTEAALWRFRTLFAAGEVDSLAFLLPTRVAATSLKGRIEKFLKDVFGSERPPLNLVLGVPGYTYADGEEATGKLAGFTTLWPDSHDESAAHRRWASEHPKRCFAAAVMVGTVDQALLGALRVRHAHLRGAALLRSLLVIDEVHASDAYMTGLLQETLARHVGAGGHAILLSATLGGAARERLLSAGTRRTRLRAGQSAAAPEPDHAGAPYPAVSDGSGVRLAPPPGAGKAVAIDLRTCISEPQLIAAEAAQAARAGARVLIVRNTVGTAMLVQEALGSTLADAPRLLFNVDGVIAMHHGRYAAEDRKVLDKAIEDALGKEAARPHGLVVVGTQTLEQSLDIDADLLITDLAPADVLLQRFGRLHRHRRARPEGFETARAIVLTPEGGLALFLAPRRGRASHGFGTSYENLPSIQATLDELKRRSVVTVPGDCRTLVESAVDAECLRALCDAWGGAWPEAWRKAIGEAIAMANQSHHAKLDWSTPWGEQTAFPRRGEERLRTRLSDDDRLVALSEPVTSPFGQRLTQMKLPGWMLQGADRQIDEDAPARILEVAPDHFLFQLDGVAFRYDRLGLRRVGAERQSAP